MQQQGYPKAPGPMRRRFDGAFGDRPAVEGADWRRELRMAILSRVVPRLAKIGEEVDVAPHASPRIIDEGQVALFAELAVALEVPGLVEHVDRLRASGVSAEAAALQLLAPAARRLGDMWLDDRLSFIDVTAGLGRLQGVFRALAPGFEAPMAAPARGRRILLAPVPGEQHIFGLSLVAAFFRRAGWEVTFEPFLDFDDMLALVRAERFDAIGLSLASDRFAGAFPSRVEALRRASLNETVAMLAGGPAFALDPELQGRAGADAVARDASEAVQMAEALCGQAAAERAMR